MEQKPSPPSSYSWLPAWRARGWAGWLLVILDITEPVHWLAAQMLYTFQPFGHSLAGGHIMRDLAQALEDPDVLHQLREELSQPERRQTEGELNGGQ